MTQPDILSKVQTIGGTSVRLFSRDGINWSSNVDDLPNLEESSEVEKSDSPFWDIPKKPRRNPGGNSHE